MAVDIISRYEILKEQFDKNTDIIESMVEKIETTQKCLAFLNGFVEYTRNQIKGKIEDIVNSALKCVFVDKKLNFKIIPAITKRGVNYELYIDTDGIVTPLTDSKGGGVLDIVTLSIRIAFVRMFSNMLRQTIILDEPFKNLDSERINPACEWLKVISKEFGVQFVIVSHISELIEGSNKVFQVVNVNGTSEVKVIKQ